MKTAFLIIDLQNDYFKDGSMELVGSEEAAEKSRKILDYFRDEKKPIIHIQHIATRDGATFFLPGTAGAEIYPLVQPQDGEKVIVKHYPNSFRETELLEYLKKQEITDLVVSGMMTHMCVDATTRAAKDLEFNLTVIADACATRALEIDENKVQAADVHNAFLAALNGTYATIMTTAQYLNELSKP